MKRLGKIYPKICSMENLRNAHQQAQKDKGFYAEVKLVNSNPDYYLSLIQEMLINHTYALSPDDYRKEVLHDRAKDRELWKLNYYPHRIIQWAIMLQIEETLNGVLTNFTCASIPNRGIHKAYLLVKRYMNDENESRYCLKLDIHHFYQSIDKDILKKLFRRKFKDPELLDLTDIIIDSCPKGLPIGSYLSQYLANFYLSYFDHWLAEELGVKRIIRYMDDIVIFSSSKEQLHEWFDKMKAYLNDNLHLEIKGNYQVFETRVRGLDFVGYRFFDAYTILRKSTYRRMVKKLISIRSKVSKGGYMSFKDYCCINSYVGWLKWCNCPGLLRKYILPVLGDADRYYRAFVVGRKNRRRKSKLEKLRISIQRKIDAEEALKKAA